MVCYVHCAIALVFLIGMVYMSFAVDKTAVNRALMKTLTPEMKDHYVHIVQSRRNLYLQGFMLGLFLSFIAIMAKKVQHKSNEFAWQDVCLAGSITFLTVYFYYILSPKPELMVVHLQTECQRRTWAAVYRTMQWHYHIGLFLGVLAVVVFMKGMCK